MYGVLSCGFYLNVTYYSCVIQYRRGCFTGEMVPASTVDISRVTIKSFTAICILRNEYLNDMNYQRLKSKTLYLLVENFHLASLLTKPLMAPSSNNTQYLQG